MAQTQVILLERVEHVGQMGDVASVKPGFARNYLLPQNKALRATKTNLAYFEGQKKVLEATNLQKRAEAEKVVKKMGPDYSVAIIRQAAEGGQLYGSVSTRDIADAITQSGVAVERTQVKLNQAFKTLGLFTVDLYLHAEVKVNVTINIARSDEEAKLQKKLGHAVVTDAEGNRDLSPTVTTDKAVFLEENALSAEAQAAAQAAQAESAEAQATAEKSAKRAAKKAPKKTDDGETTTETPAE
jgi:large subunit ribosomal protein L9